MRKNETSIPCLARFERGLVRGELEGPCFATVLGRFAESGPERLELAKKAELDDIAALAAQFGPGADVLADRFVDGLVA